ncbi:MAG TPA: hypothetical protein VGO60_05505 [Iamia sp.]|nr:hypothetical protein [Iamia sp.]
MNRIRTATSRRGGRLVPVFLALVMVATGCFKMQKDDFVVEVVSVTTARVTISRHSTRDLYGLIYKATRGTTYAKEKASAEQLRSQGINKIECPGPCTDFVRDRWNGATGPDQYSDLGEALRATDVHDRSVCINVKIKAGAGFGYDWYTSDIRTQLHPYWYETNCFWGRDPVPAYP